MELKDIIEMLASFFAGATISAVATVRVCKSKYQRITNTKQTENKAGGNIVGGDYRR